MTTVKEARFNRKRRHLRIRRKVKGTALRPRLCVFRSLNHIYAQVLDDVDGRTIVSASSLDPELEKKSRTKCEDAKLVGKLVGTRAVDKGISLVVFDRGGYQYHGRVRLLADAAREAGLKF